MGRRGSSIGSMFSNMLKVNHQFRMGKLYFTPSHYILSDEGTTTRGGVFIPSSLDRHGKPMSLKKGKGHSRCPDPPKDAPLMEQGYSVSYRDCRSCNSYSKGGYCLELRHLRQMEIEAAKPFQILQKATDAALKILENHG